MASTSTFSLFTCVKGAADALVGVILLTKPELIYHSAFSKALSKASGLRLPNPYPGVEAKSAQHVVAIMVIAVGLSHVRASINRALLPPFIMFPPLTPYHRTPPQNPPNPAYAMIVLLNGLWSAFALLTVLLAPGRATSALLMTGVNHAVFASVMWWRTNVSVREILGLGEVGNKERME